MNTGQYTFDDNCKIRLAPTKLTETAEAWATVKQGDLLLWAKEHPGAELPDWVSDDGPAMPVLSEVEGAMEPGPDPIEPNTPEVT